MNYANYAVIHSRHLSDKVCLIERTPSKNERRTLTWRQFNDEINKVANYLSKELGIKDGDFVMHLQNNSLEWIITYYAIIKIGAVIVPLNFRFVGQDILYAAQISNPKAFLLGSEFLPVVQHHRSAQSQPNSEGEQYLGPEAYLFAPGEAPRLWCNPHSSSGRTQPSYSLLRRPPRSRE